MQIDRGARKTPPNRLARQIFSGTVAKPRTCAW